MNICSCMTIQQADGSYACRQCRGDIYACECSLRHSIRCSDHPANKENVK